MCHVWIRDCLSVHLDWIHCSRLLLLFKPHPGSYNLWPVRRSISLPLETAPTTEFSGSDPMAPQDGDSATSLISAIVLRITAHDVALVSVCEIPTR